METPAQPRGRLSWIVENKSHLAKREGGRKGNRAGHGWGTKVGSGGELSRREGRAQRELQGALRPGTPRGRRPRGASGEAEGRGTDRVEERLRIARSGWGNTKKPGSQKGWRGWGREKKDAPVPGSAPQGGSGRHPSSLSPSLNHHPPNTAGIRCPPPPLIATDLLLLSRRRRSDSRN